MEKTREEWDELALHYWEVSAGKALQNANHGINLIGRDEWEMWIDSRDTLNTAELQGRLSESQRLRVRMADAVVRQYTLTLSSYFFWRKVVLSRVPPGAAVDRSQWWFFCCPFPHLRSNGWPSEVK
eukprot:GILK01009534.1.p1 GENE.GILK01009534.1~~GILK01009534.1.p1  ORF type:complete len:138 (+),score=14.27 GILK01009534.1:38-415(+)